MQKMRKLKRILLVGGAALSALGATVAIGANLPGFGALPNDVAAVAATRSAQREVAQLPPPQPKAPAADSGTPSPAQLSREAAPSSANLLPAWSANQLMLNSLGTSSQFNPAIALGGSNTLLVWTDERNSQTDVFARVMTGTTSGPEEWVSRHGTDEIGSDSDATGVMLSDGRAFVAYTRIQARWDRPGLWLARREPSGAWISRTQVLPDLQPYDRQIRYPVLAANGDALLVAWEEANRQTGNGDGYATWDIFAARCNGATLTCQAAVKINGDAGNAAQKRPAVAMNGNNAVVAWEDWRNSSERPNVFASISSDGGASWSANERVNANASDAASNPSVTIDGSGNAGVAWLHHGNRTTAPADVYAAQRSGGAWVQRGRVDGAPAGTRALQPGISAGAAGVFVAWQDFRTSQSNPAVFTARWTGSTWTESLVSSTTARQSAPVLGQSGSSVRVAWQDWRNGKPDVYSAGWGGSAWNAATRTNDDASQLSRQIHPSLVALSNGDLVSSWLDSRERLTGQESQFLLARLPRGASAWQPMTTSFSNNAKWLPHAFEQAAMTVDETGQLHVAYAQEKEGTGFEVFYVALEGNDWHDPVQISDTGPITAWNPNAQAAIAARNGRIAVAWQNIVYQDGVWPNFNGIYVKVFDGTTWGNRIQIHSAPLRGEGRPSIGFDSAGNLHVAYADYRWQTVGANTGLLADVILAKINAGASSVASRTRVNSAVSTMPWCVQHRPQLQIDAASRLHLAWTGCDNWTRYIYHASSANGTTWPAQSTRVHTLTEETPPTLAVGSSGEVNVMFADRAGGSQFNFYSARLYTGTWETGRLVSDGATNWQQDNGSDGPPAMVYDAAGNRYVAAFADRRMRELPLLRWSSQPSFIILPTATPTPTPTATPTGTRQPTAIFTPTRTPTSVAPNASPTPVNMRPAAFLVMVMSDR